MQLFYAKTIIKAVYIYDLSPKLSLSFIRNLNELPQFVKSNLISVYKKG